MANSNVGTMAPSLGVCRARGPPARFDRPGGGTTIGSGPSVEPPCGSAVTGSDHMAGRCHRFGTRRKDVSQLMDTTSSARSPTDRNGGDRPLVKKYESPSLVRVGSLRHLLGKSGSDMDGASENFMDK